MRRYIRELRPTSVYDLAAMVALYRPGPDGQHPGLHPPQARPGAGDVPPPAARAVPGEDLRDLRLPGGHHGRGHRPRRVHRARGGHARLRHPQEEVDACSAPRRRSSSPRPPSGASTPKVIDAVFKAFEPFERYGFNKAHATCYGLIAYQTAYLKANYTVDYMTAVLTAFRDERGEGRGGGRRVPAHGHRGPAAGRPRAASSSSPSRARPSASGCWRSRTSGRARSSRSSRRATAGGAVPVARRLLRAGSTCGWPTGRSSSRSSRSARSTRSATRRSSSHGLDDADRAPAPGDPARPDHAARPRCSTSARRTPRPSSGRCRARPRRPSASGCAGRRSCSGCTSRSTRWARSPSRSGEFVNAYSGDLSDESLDGQRVVVGGIVDRACGRSSPSARRRWPS